MLVVWRHAGWPSGCSPLLESVHLDKLRRYAPGHYVMGRGCETYQGDMMGIVLIGSVKLGKLIRWR